MTTPSSPCPVCHDKRFVYYHVAEVADPRFGQAQPCPHCAGTYNLERLERMCGLRGDQLGFRFDNTPWESFQRPAVAALRKTVESGIPAGFVLISGGYGTGKTRMLACTVNAARARGWTARYMSTESALQELRDSYEDDEYTETLQRLENIQVLCLDEFGRHNTTNWAEATLFQLLDARYRRATECHYYDLRLTVLATNFAEVDGYLMSRFGDVRHRNVFYLTINGHDMRLRR